MPVKKLTLPLTYLIYYIINDGYNCIPAYRDPHL